VSIITTNKASNEVLPYGMYTIAKKLCQVISQSSRLRMSETVPPITPYTLMAWTEKTLLFNIMKEIHQFLIMLVYVIVLKHRRKTVCSDIQKNVSFQLHYAEYCSASSLVFCMHDREIDPILILSSSEHRFQLGGYVKAVRI
jgi:hypothetical protein